MRLRRHTWFALLAAAVLLAVANLNGRAEPRDYSRGGTVSFGWPRTFHRDHYVATFSYPPIPSHHGSETDRAALVIDVLVAVMLLFAAAAVSEHLAPKRAGDEPVG